MANEGYGSIPTLALHLGLDAIALIIFYFFNKFNLLWLNAQFIINQVNYYEELPIVYFTVIISLALAAFVIFAAHKVRKENMELSSFIIYLFFAVAIFFVLRSFTVAQITAHYGDEYFFYNFYLYLVGFVAYWGIIACTICYIEDFE